MGAVPHRPELRFGKQDPFATITCGNQTFRTKTHIDGGKNPVSLGHFFTPQRPNAHTPPTHVDRPA